MNADKNAGLDEEFVGRQRQLLEDLLVRLFRARATLEADETDWEKIPLTRRPNFLVRATPWSREKLTKRLQTELQRD